MIRMSKEFATRSMTISEGTDVLANHQLNKMWDKSLHAFMFFNDGGTYHS